MPTPEPALWSLEWWKEAADIVQSAFVCLTAIVALLGINEWRRQTVGKRKIELAEQVLASFYEARDLFVWVRSPAAFGGEGETRQAEGEDENVRRSRNTYFVPIERMQKHSELFAKLQSQRYSFMALFGADAVAPFNELRQVQVRISVSAQTLIGMVGNRAARERNQALWDRCESDIWEGMYEANEQEDPLKTSIANLINRIETLCRPVLLNSEWSAFRPSTWFKRT
jgi:hypothetical protein